jgi:alpha-ribazole phosphatase
MVKIHLIRHGETDGNVEKRHQNSLTPLNENGLNQAAQVSEKLKNIKFSAIYSSPFKRTLQTAEEIAKYHNHLELKKVHNLHERHFGDFVGLTKKEILAIMPDINEQFEKHKSNWKAPNGESMREVQERALNALKEIAEKHPEDENIAVISHGGVILTILSHILNVDIDNVFDIRHPNNGEIIEIDWNKEKINVFYK